MKKFFLRHKYLLLILLGTINSLPFIFDKASLISWISFAPFLFIVAKNYSLFNNGKELFYSIFFFFFSYYLGAYHFFLALYPMTFAGIGKLLSAILLLLAWVLLSGVHSFLVSALSFYLIRHLKSCFVKAFSVAILFVLFEYILSVGPLAFPWARFSLLQSNTPVLIQAASFFGPYFVDFLMMMTNSLVAASFLSDKKILFLIASIILFLSNLVFGIVYSNKERNTDAKTNVALIQGNVLTDSKWDGASSYDIYMSETLELQGSHDIIVWSETAIPTELNTSQKISRELVSFARYFDKEMIVGAFYSDGRGSIYNGAYLVDDSGISEEVYFKRKLVPFGEYLPLRKMISAFSFFDGINLYLSDLSEGDTPVAFVTKRGKIGTLICFDSVFQNLARDTVKKGAELIVILTNDSWYKDFPAVHQHNAQAVWRAVENGRCVVRCANSGISSFIMPNGKIASSLPPLTRGTLSEEVYFLSEFTLYTNIGDVIILPIFFALLFLLMIENKKAFAFRQKR